MDYIIDATNQKLGRLASRIALILQGKLHADFEPHLIGKDRVIVKNASKIIVTGKKYTDKIYYHHSGYMGHLKSKTFKEFFHKSPEVVLRLAVKRMLPQNFLRDKRLKKLAIER